MRAADQTSDAVTDEKAEAVGASTAEQHSYADEDDSRYDFQSLSFISCAFFF